MEVLFLSITAQSDHPSTKTAPDRRTKTLLPAGDRGRPAVVTPADEQYKLVHPHLSSVFAMRALSAVMRAAEQPRPPLPLPHLKIGWTSAECKCKDWLDRFNDQTVSYRLPQVMAHSELITTSKKSTGDIPVHNRTTSRSSEVCYAESNNHH